MVGRYAKKERVGGIYCITYLQYPGYYYIGQTQSFRQRKYSHKYWLRHHKHDNPFLQHIWEKYQGEGFTFTPLEYLIDKRILTLQKRESYWLYQYLSQGFTLINRPYCYEYLDKI